MYATCTNPFPQTESESFPIDIFFFDEFKFLVNSLFKKTSYGKKRRFYQYEPFHFVAVKLFSLSLNISVHQAAEILNWRFSEYHEKEQLNSIKIFKDGKRKRRKIPHQTDIDQIFRNLTEKDVKTLWGGILDHFARVIIKKQLQNRTWLSMVDNTKFPYYGKKHPKKHIGSHKLPGTNVAWMFQGISLHSKDIHVFTGFHSLTKGIYRALKVPDSVAWQRFIDPNIHRIAFDREFYRAKLVGDLKKMGVKCIFPTKKFAWVKYKMTQFLHGKKGLVIGNIFSQSNKQYPKQVAAFVHLVIIGKNNEMPWDIRAQFQAGLLTEEEALKKLSGFFTTYRPWKNHKAWIRYLIREYKRRWNIETGFSMLNFIHFSSRARLFTAKLVDLYARAILYDWWQSWRIYKMKEGYHHRDYTLNEFKWYAADRIYAILRD